MKESSDNKFSIGYKMYLFVIFTVLIAAFGVVALSYAINVDQIDTYFKRLTINNAQNAATLIDIDYMRELRAVAESDEYQAIREAAEEAEDEEMVIAYLQEKGLWDKYVEQRDILRTYVSNMSDIKYLYVVAWGEKGSEHDMYVIDADDVEVYETGYYEVREAEFEGVDPTRPIEPVINNGDWGWLCSGYYPVYDEDGNIVCHVGCDVDMEYVMSERSENLTLVIMGAFGLTAIMLAGAILFVGKVIVNPLSTLTREMKKYDPAPNKDYAASGVIDLDIKRKDEIGDIYHEIQNMQMRIVDYVNDITNIEKDKQKIEDSVKRKDKEIGEISKEAYRDALTGVGNKASYTRKSNELDSKIADGFTEFAIVMMDVNCLKMINDNHGHAAGDTYLKGCCHVICEILKHSPVYRIGGDEFVAVLTGDDYNNRAERVQELRDAFDRSFHRTDIDPWLRFSASVGIAEYDPSDKTVEVVFQRADKLMYEEKAGFKEENSL